MSFKKYPEDKPEKGQLCLVLSEKNGEERMVYMPSEVKNPEAAFYRWGINSGYTKAEDVKYWKYLAD